MHTNIELELQSSLKDMERRLQEDMKKAFDHVNAAATHVPPRPVDQHELTYPFNVSLSSFMEGKGGQYRSGKSCSELQQDYEKLSQKMWFGSEKIDAMMNTFYPDVRILANGYKHVKILHRTSKLAVRTSDLLDTVVDAKEQECPWAKDTEMLKKSKAYQQLTYVMNKANPGLQEAQHDLRGRFSQAKGDGTKQAEAFESFISALTSSFGPASASSLKVNTAHLNEDFGVEKVTEVLNKEKTETATLSEQLASNLDGTDQTEQDEGLPTSVPKTSYWKAVAWGMKCEKDDRVLKLNMEGSSSSAFERCLKAQSNNGECSKKQFYVNDNECWCIKQGKTCSIREDNIRAGSLLNGHTLYEWTEPPAWEAQSMVQVSSNTPEAWQVPGELMIPEGGATNSTTALAMQSALAEMQRRSLRDDLCDGPLVFLCIIGAILSLIVVALWILALLLTCGVILVAIFVWLIGLIKCIFQFLYLWLKYLATSLVGGGVKPTFNWGECLGPWWLVGGQEDTNLMTGCLCVLMAPGMANSGWAFYGLHPCR